MHTSPADLIYAGKLIAAAIALIIAIIMLRQARLREAEAPCRLEAEDTRVR